MSALAAILLAIITILTKKLVNSKVHFTVSIIYPGFVGIPLNLAISMIIFFFALDKRPPEYYKDSWTIAEQSVIAVCSGIASLLTQVAVVIGLRYEEPAKFSVIRSSDLFFTLVLQATLLGIYANAFSIVGALLIFAATVLIILYKIVEKRNAQASKQSTCWRNVLFYKI